MVGGVTRGVELLLFFFTIKLMKVLDWLLVWQRL